MILKTFLDLKYHRDWTFKVKTDFTNLRPFNQNIQKWPDTFWQLTINAVKFSKFVRLFCGTFCIKRLNSEFLQLTLLHKQRSLQLTISSVNVTISAISRICSNSLQKSMMRNLIVCAAKPWTYKPNFAIIYHFHIKNANIIKISISG